MQTTHGIKLVTLAGLLIGICAITACKSKPSSGGMPSGPPPEVGVLTVSTAPLNLTLELPGRVAPRLLAEVRPQVGGIVQQRLFTEGSGVQAGQVLYQLNAAPSLAALAAADATVAKAEAGLTPSRLKEERFRELVAIKAVSSQDYDDAAAALKLAEAELGAAKAARQTAQINLAYTKITAPISGRIGRSTVSDGALVTANQTGALATIQQLNPIYVDLSQSSSELLRLKRDLAGGSIKKNGEGQAKVRLLLEDGSPYPLEGSLKFSELTVEPSTGSVTLRALFPNPEHLLLPGMFVRAIIQEGVKDEAILVPQRGVSRNPKGEAMVMVVGAEEKVEPRPITVSRTVGDSWLVSEGLKAGDRVILEGIQKARPGSAVKAVPFGSKPDAAHQPK